MSTPKPRKTQSKDIMKFWGERGFRPDLAQRPLEATEDPKGERAYQRAFFEAAQQDPPRLPNPNHYPNSQSAQEYMRKRSIEFLPMQGEKRPNGSPLETQYTNSRYREPEQISAVSARKSASTSPASNYSTGAMQPPSAFMASPRYEDQAYNSYGYPPQTQQQQTAPPRLSAMEPRLGGPQGPGRKLY